MDFYIPDGASLIIDRLEASGSSAYIVGGAVRDALMGRVADDFDITTSMRPESIKALFSDLRTIDTGIKHGTVTVLASGGQYEVTTYRIDGEYDDCRHPGEVSFTDKIEDDLARRDFTVNAIAYSPSRGICDPYGGIEDISAGIIRAVGDPQIRFSEDALRIMRAIRFSSVLGFSIEEGTKRAIYDKLPLLAKVSRERVLVEWKKLLGGKNAYPVLTEYRDAIASVIPELSGFTLGERRPFEALSATERMIYLFVEIGRDGWLAAISSLKADNRLKKLGSDILFIADVLMTYDEDGLARCYAKYDVDSLRSAISIAKARKSYNPLATEYIGKLISSGAPQGLSELAVGGEDMKALGFSGEAVGKALGALHIAVIRGLVKNLREELISYAQSNNICI